MSSKNNPDVSLISLFVVAALGTLVGVPVVLLSAHVMVELWGWWAVPYGLTPLPFWTAVAVNFIYGLLRGPTRDLVATAEYDAIYESAGSNIEFLLVSGYWLLKRGTGTAAFVLLVWGVCFLIHHFQ